MRGHHGITSLRSDDDWLNEEARGYVDGRTNWSNIQLEYAEGHKVRGVILCDDGRELPVTLSPSPEYMTFAPVQATVDLPDGWHRTYNEKSLETALAHACEDQGGIVGTLHPVQKRGVA